MPRAGRKFEQLAQALEKYLANDGVTVESPGFLEDRITGQLREIDVLISRGIGHHKHLIAIECRDRSTPIGVPDVEAFHTKTKDLQINKAVFISSSGFRKTAIEKAVFYNISCLDIEDIESFDWLLTDCIHYHEKKLLKAHWTINTNDREAKVVKDLVVKTKNGDQVTIDILVANARKIFNELDISHCEIGKVYCHVFPVSQENLIMVNELNGNEYQVAQCEVYLEWQYTITDLPFKLIKYGDVTEGLDIAKGAIVEIQSGGMDGHLMMIEQKDGSKKMLFVKNNNT